MVVKEESVDYFIEITTTHQRPRREREDNDNCDGMAI